MDIVSLKFIITADVTPCKLNSVALVRERTIPAKREPLVGEASANFCGYMVSCGQQSGSLWPYSWFLDLSPYYFFQAALQLYSRGWVDTVPDPLLLRKPGSAGNRTGDLWICSQIFWPVDNRETPYKMYWTEFPCFRINYSLICESVKVNSLFRLKTVAIRCKALNIHKNCAPRNESSMQQLVVLPGITSLHCHWAVLCLPGTIQHKNHTLNSVCNVLLWGSGSARWLYRPDAAPVICYHPPPPTISLHYWTQYNLCSNFYSQVPATKSYRDVINPVITSHFVY
jgi:hypothetical protein